MSSKNVRGGTRGSFKTIETERRSQPEVTEIRTALLTTHSSGEMENSKNGSHAPSSATIAVEEYADGEKTPEGSIKTRKLAHIKQRVSQEFNQSTTCRKWLTWLIHLVCATLPYVAILMGAIYRDDCAANRNIPMHLIVSGVVIAILHLSVSIDLYRRLPYIRSKEKPAIFTLAFLFLFIWMILGCVWTFSIFIPEYDWGTMWRYESRWDSYGVGYCNYSLYWFAFAFNIFALIAFFVAFSLCCCVGCMLCNTSIITCLCNKIKDDCEDEPVQV